MDIEKILFEYTCITGTIQKLNGELNEIIKNKEQMMNILKPEDNSEGDCVCEQSNPMIKAVEKIIDRYESNVKYILQRMQDLIEIKDVVNKALQCLDTVEYRFIELRYFNKLPWFRIPSALKCSRSQCYRIKDRTLQKITDILLKSNLGETMERNII